MGKQLLFCCCCCLFFHFCSRLLELSSAAESTGEGTSRKARRDQELAGLPPPLVHITDMPLVVLRAQHLHLKPDLGPHYPAGHCQAAVAQEPLSRSARVAFLLHPYPCSSVPVLGGPDLGPQEGRMLTLIASLFSSGVFVRADELPFLYINFAADMFCASNRYEELSLS